MERVTGIIIRKNNADYSKDIPLSKESAIELARIHTIPEHVLPNLGKSSGYVARQLRDGFEDEEAKTIDLQEWIVEFVAYDQAKDQGNQIIHNDYKYITSSSS